ncbi:MAG TPA: hypothetical protein VGI46_12090 [Candidatus Acidoferrum sp.]|jgi:hypothetical protein
MNGKVSWLLGLFCASFFPVPAFAQCSNQQDKACWSLQYILYAAETDFREFRGSPPLKPGDPRVTPPNPDLSVGSIRVPCRQDFWLTSEVPVYTCSAEVPAQEAEEWYAKTMADLHELQYLWQFKSQSPGADHYVDAGPQGCEVPQVETTRYGPYHFDEPYIVDGPYLGQCPLHLQTVRQDRGTVRISFWLNSSVNLARNPAPPSNSLELSASVKGEAPQPRSTDAAAIAPPLEAAPAVAAPAIPASATPEKVRVEPAAKNSGTRASKRYSDCDDLCQGLKKALEDRASSFRQSSARSGSSVSSKTTSPGDAVRLSGAASCVIHAEPSATAGASARNAPVSSDNFAPVSTKGAKAVSSRAPGSPAMQYVCYWPQDSEAAAESEFLDLVALLRFLIPSSWLTQQRVEADERSGEQLTVWSARDSRKKAVIALYMSGRSVGLHISAGP